MEFCIGMWTVVVLFVVRVNFVHSIYFTISDVDFTIPRTVRPTSNIRDVPIIELNARSTENRATKTIFSLNITGQYLVINPSTGGVFLTPAFLRASQSRELYEIEGTAYVQDIETGDRDQTLLRVTVSPQDELLDCDKFVEEICFWSGATYRLEKRSGTSRMGTLSSPYLLEICPYRINYTVVTGESFRVIPPDDMKSSWSIGTTQSIRNIKKPSVRLLCTLENINGREKGAIRNIEKNLEVKLLNIDAYAPEPQYLERNITLFSTNFKKIVAVPFLAAMIILYIVAGTTDLWKASDRNYLDDDSLSPNDYCYPTLVAGIVKHTFHDKLDNMDLTYTCNGGFIGMDIVITSSACFRNLEVGDIKSFYRVTSSSKYWSVRNNKHFIREVHGFNGLNKDGGEIDTQLEGLVLLKISPPATSPSCLINGNSIELVEPKQDQELIHKGWTYPVNEAIEPYKQLNGKIGDKLISNGALVFTKDEKLVGLQAMGSSEMKIWYKIFGKIKEIFPDDNGRYKFIDST